MTPCARNRAAAPEQAAELHALLDQIAAGWSGDDREEALRVALADPEGALICFRALAAEPQAALARQFHHGGTK